MILPLLLVFTAAAAATAGEPCRVSAPYRGVAVVRVTYSSASSADSLRASLARVCGLRLLHPEGGPSPSADVLLLSRVHRRLLAGDPRAKRVDVLDADLSATIARESAEVAPYPAPVAMLAAAPSERSGGGRGIRPLAPEAVGGIVNRFRPLPPPRTRLPHASPAGVKDSYYANYHTYADLLDYYHRLNGTHSSLRLEVIGKSVEGRPLHLFRVGRTRPANPVRVLVSGMQHSREWITTLAALYTTEALAVSASSNSPLARLLKQMEVLILPLVNPDGFVYTHTHDRLWRKNRQRDSCSIGLHKFIGGVDLNRNWGVDFGGNRSTSASPCDNLYTGRKAFSAPETAAVRDFVYRTAGIKGHIDLHAYSQLVIGPWLHSRKDPPNATVIDRVGRAVTRALSADGARYVYGRGKTSPIYRASGTMTDWLFGLGVLSFTFELRPTQETDDGFHLARKQILPACQDVFSAMNVFIDNIAQLHGVGAKRSILQQRRRLITYSLTGIGLAVAVAFVAAVTCWMLRRRRQSGKMYKFRSEGLEAEQGSTIDVDDDGA